MIIGAAFAALCIGAVAAYATTSPNNYGGSGFSGFAPKKSGSTGKPSPLSFVETLKAQPGAGNVRAAPLTKIVTKIYGVVSNGGAFPTCTAAKITAAANDNVCNPKALVATGFVNSLLGNPNLSQQGAPCNPGLHAWNGGPGKLVFFFFTDASHTCGSLHTGQTAPYVGTVKRQGGFLVTTVPLPRDISTSVANIPNFYGSLIFQKLTFLKKTTKKNGKTVGYNSSVACKHGKRPWSITYQAFNGGQTQTKTVSGSSKC
jgi:hypothetical protein